VSIIESSILYFSNISKDINHSLDHEVQQVFYFILSSIIAFVHGILGLFMRAFFDWFNLRKEKEQLTKQNHLIEMELVKAQLNPHFLFNSLNNIDVLIYKDQDQASAYLNKLSDILRYMLFEAKTDYISFDTEFHFIEKYIALHQLRASNSDYVLLNNELKSNNGMVASLVFMPFIENAFKYSSSYKEGNAIQIQFEQNENYLNFVCKNRITKDNDAFTTSNGLGNELLKKRLELIYKEEYTLNFHDENGYFCVALTIPYEAN
jgi:LytS/YehU family sensor histidine kinase